MLVMLSSIVAIKQILYGHLVILTLRIISYQLNIALVITLSIIARPANTLWSLNYYLSLPRLPSHKIALPILLWENTLRSLNYCLGLINLTSVQDCTGNIVVQYSNIRNCPLGHLTITIPWSVYLYYNINT